MQVNARHVPCVRCEYDLFGLTAPGTCPECGVPLAQSYDAGRLYYREVGLLRKVRRLLVVWLLVTVALPASGVLESFVSMGDRVALLIEGGLDVALVSVMLLVALTARRCCRERGFRLFGNVVATLGGVTAMADTLSVVVGLPAGNTVWFPTWVQVLLTTLASALMAGMLVLLGHLLATIPRRAGAWCAYVAAAFFPLAPAAALANPVFVPWRVDVGAVLFATLCLSELVAVAIVILTVYHLSRVIGWCEPSDPLGPVGASAPSGGRPRTESTYAGPRHGEDGG